MADQIQFSSREEFRKWLGANCETSGGVWLVFGKPGGPKTVTPDDALEEALCFGWIDGQIQRVDDQTYMKYFSRRIGKSKWSEKNKAAIDGLIQRGLMTQHGLNKMEEAKKNGMWDVAKREPITQDQIELLTQALMGREPAYTNFMAMSPSVKRTYTAMYLDAKTEETRIRRLEKIVGRLDSNLKPM